MSSRRFLLMGAGKPIEYMTFEDPVVEQICKDNWGTSKGITTAQAAAVTSLGRKFMGNQEIVSFEELEYFGISKLNAGYNNSDFYKCSSLQRIKLPPKMNTIVQWAFQSCAALVSCPLDNIVEIQDGAFMGCSSLNVPLPETIVKIGNRAFSGAKMLEQVVNLPNLESIGYGGLASTGITRVESLGKVTRFTYSAGYSCFNGCTNLEYLCLPETTEFVGTWTFAQCTKLSTVKILASTPPETQANTFFSLSSTLTFYVPDESVETYKASEYWAEVVDRIKPLSEYNV